jgi:hypothetical protein
LYKWILFLKIKNIYFQIIFLIWALLHNILFYFILFNQFNVYLFLLSFDWIKKLILINKLNKHNRINILSCRIKYFDQYMSWFFSVLFLVIVNDFFLLTHMVLDLFYYIYARGFWFILRIFLIYKNLSKKHVCIIIFARNK